MTAITAQETKDTTGMTSKHCIVVVILAWPQACSLLGGKKEMQDFASNNPLFLSFTTDLQLNWIWTKSREFPES